MCWPVQVNARLPKTASELPFLDVRREVAEVLATISSNFTVDVFKVWAIMMKTTGPRNTMVKDTSTNRERNEYARIHELPWKYIWCECRFDAMNKTLQSHGSRTRHAVDIARMANAVRSMSLSSV